MADDATGLDLFSDLDELHPHETKHQAWVTTISFIHDLTLTTQAPISTHFFNSSCKAQGRLSMEVWDLVNQLELTVVDRVGPHQSGYHPGERTIHLRPGMKGRVARSVLAHEIAHHVLGHRPTTERAARWRQEAAAQEWAAHALITPESYAAAERLHSAHVPAMAFDLNVADELVVVYQKQLLRIADDVYVKPRMGLGQWSHRAKVA